ncbi:hypothetical protein SKAU_G00099790 [Synaphobranchus kaupii]|uniref:Uncharacterized protein n=1 Tax=Synaphobranchus kaupii TaxID=118154 RepID=A0A9Q1FZC1_SYNKA|nr:hypothetical protein SKAU_G00099790 [Synaphobranchus kaupii]
MATPTAAPMTRFLWLRREAASVRKSSSPLDGIVPARLNHSISYFMFRASSHGRDQSHSFGIVQWKPPIDLLRYLH